jgi:hypothetical protein
MAESKNGTITPSAGNWPDQRAGQWPGSYYQNELGKLLPEPFPPPFPPMEAPSLDRLTREYVAGGGWAWYGQVARTLPAAIDDATADFGDDLYERMMYDPQVAAVVNIFKASILETGIALTSAVRSRSHPDYDIAAEITDEAAHMLSEFQGNLDDVLFNMLDCVAFGNKVAEQTYKLDAARKDGRKILVLDTLKVRPRRATVFAVDIYMNVVGLLVRVPPNASPWSATMMFGPQDEPFNLLPPAKFVISQFRTRDADPRGTALDPETPIPTPDGWRRLDDLQAGDKVFDEQGRIRYVTARRDWEERPCYELVFRGGESIIADINHQWATNLAWERSQKRPTKIRTTQEIVNTLRNSTGLANHSIPWAKALDYPEQILPVAPYFLGLWLGDGTSANASISCHARDVDETVALIEGCGYSTTVVANGRKSGNGRHIRVGGNARWDSTGPTHGLRFIHVSGQRSENKHVPDPYKRSSVTQRRELLAGLMDSDGYVDAYGRCEFSNTIKSLAEDVAELARSLGVPAVVRRHHTAHLGKDGRQRKESWIATFTPPWSPFKLSRKAARTINARAQRQHYIVDARPVPNRRTVCIETDGPSHLYLAGKAMIPTHNSILRPAYGPWWQKQQIIPEYLRYLTQFASPSIYGIVGPDAIPLPDPTNPGAQVSVEQVLLSSLQQFRNGTAGAFPTGTEIHTIQQTGDGLQFLKAFDHWDGQIVKAVLTQSLATQEGQHMARAAAQVHQDVLDTLIRQAKLGFARQLRNQMLKRWVSYNWGEKAMHLAPMVGLGKALTRDQPALWTAVSQLFNSGYLAPSQQQETDELIGLPVRDETEVLGSGEVVVTEEPQQPAPALAAPADGGAGNAAGGAKPGGAGGAPGGTTTSVTTPPPASLPPGPDKKATPVQPGLPGRVAVTAHTRQFPINSRGDVPGVTGTTPQPAEMPRKVPPKYGRNVRVATAPGQRPAPGARKGVYAVAEPQASGMPGGNVNLPLASPSSFG